MNRTVFLVDGFNLYHSVRSAAKALSGVGTKWLDLRALCASYLYIVGNGATLDAIYYFSALATHLERSNPDVTKRHRALIEAFEASGVIVELGRFKQKTLRCEVCGAGLLRHEEKETDVAIAMKLYELFHSGRCESAVIVSGDTDLAPAVRTVAKLFPAAKVLFAFPYARKNKELAQLAPGSFTISKEAYARYQLPDPVVAPDGRVLHKPAAW